MDIGTPVQFVKGVGPQRAEGLRKAGVSTVEDLLFHLPMRYEDRRAFAKIGELRAGMRASVAGEIVAAGLRRARRMSLYEIRIEDGTGRLKALWFNQPYLRESLVRGRRPEDEQRSRGCRSLCRRRAGCRQVSLPAPSR